MKDKGIRKMVLTAFVVLSWGHAARAQDVALKTNLLYDATLTVNAGVEVGLAPRWSLDLSGNYNAWTIRGHKWKHWLAQPELRWWFCDRFAGHFLGLHALGGQYNVGNIDANLKFLNMISNTDFSVLKDHRYQGWAVGGGIAYGYAFILGEHWNLELEAGFGCVYTEFDKYECKDCGQHVGSGNHVYVGPTKAAINLVYLF